MKIWDKIDYEQVGFYLAAGVFIGGIVELSSLSGAGILFGYAAMMLFRRIYPDVLKWAKRRFGTKDVPWLVDQATLDSVIKYR